MTRSDIIEFLCVRDSVCLCDRLIQSIAKLEDEANIKIIKDEDKLTLHRVLRTLRLAGCALSDRIVFEDREGESK